MLGKKSRWIAPLAATAAVLLAASSASAATVTRPPNPPDAFVPAGLGCDFNLGLSGTGGKITQITFSNGNYFKVGKGVLLTWTNLDNEKSYTVNTAGSVTKFIKNPDGNWSFTSTGHSGFVYFPADRPGDQGGAGAYQYIGRLALTIDSPDTVNVLAITATPVNSVDICELLK